MNQKTNHPKHLAILIVILLILLPVSSAFSLKDTNLPLAPLLSGGNDRFTFTGQEKDKSGLMYYGARYYDPFTMHFTQPDTILPDVYDPQQLNRYSYVRNNPVKYTDETGNWADTVIDVGSMVYDIKQILEDPTDLVNHAAFFADLAAAFVPLATGAGAAVRGLAKVDDVVKAVRVADKAENAADVLRAVDKMADVARVADKGVDVGRGTAKTGNKADDIVEISKKSTKEIDFYGTSNQQVVPFRTPKGREITPHAAERMANPPPHRSMTTPSEVDMVADAGVIKKIDFTRGTTTYWNPFLSSKPEVIVSNTHNGRIVTVINKKTKRWYENG